MNERVEAYLQTKKAEENERQKRYRGRILLDAGLYNKEYPQTETYEYSEYPEWDNDEQKNFKIVPIEVTDEEFREIEKYKKKTENHSVVGKQIMEIATILLWINIIAAIVGGFYMMCIDEDLIITGFLVATIGTLVGWITGRFVYAFGKLVDDTHAIRTKIEK